MEPDDAEPPPPEPSSPEPNNPLGPYYPAELPSIEGNGRRWFAILMASCYLGMIVVSFLLFLAYHFG